MLKVATWNVNSIHMRLERLFSFLQREKPDILCLQELKCMEEKFPKVEFEKFGYFACVFGQKTYNGVAILSRVEPKDVIKGFQDGVTDDSARLVSATLAGCRVYSVYVPNGQAVGTEKYQYKLEWFKRLKAHLKAKHSPKDKVILAGDFNVVPEDRDVHDPKAWEGQVLFSEPEKEALRSVVDFGIVDTFRLHHSEAGFYSWWDYRQLAFPLDKGLRIDFIFATKTLAEKCDSASIVREERKGTKPSDHVPVMAEFEG